MPSALLQLSPLRRHEKRAGSHRVLEKMKLKIAPPEGFCVESCQAHLRHVVRTRTKGARVRAREDYIELIGAVPELLALKFQLRRFGYSPR